MEIEQPSKQPEEPLKPESDEVPTVLQPSAAPVEPAAVSVESTKPEVPVELNEVEKPTETRPVPKETAAKVMPPPQVPQQAAAQPGGAQPPHIPPYHQGYQGYSAYGPYQHYPQHYPSYGYHNQFPQGPGYAPTPYHYGAPQQSPPGPPPTAMTEHAPPVAASEPIAAEPDKKPE